jgi:hypothetical protein
LLCPGFAELGAAESLTQGIPTVGRIPNGGLIERNLPAKFSQIPDLVLELSNPDFKTAIRITDAINRYARERYGIRVAKERDYRSVDLTPPPKVSLTRFIAEIESIRVRPDQSAKVVIDERTGTVVIGKDVQISTVAITHGNLTVRISEAPEVSQPAPFSQGRDCCSPDGLMWMRRKPAGGLRLSVERIFRHWCGGSTGLACARPGSLQSCRRSRQPGLFRQNWSFNKPAGSVGAHLEQRRRDFAAPFVAFKASTASRKLDQRMSNQTGHSQRTMCSCLNSWLNAEMPVF